MNITEEVIKVPITTKDSILVKVMGPDLDISGPLWAINWFNYKYAWMYNIYLKFAIPIVEKIGARMYFKGELNRVLEGEEKDSRGMLVIVNYPGIQPFLALLKNKFFQLLSILRTKSVSNFVFGFTLNQQPPIQKKNSIWQENKQVRYLVHHFTGGRDQIARIRKLAEDIQIEGVSCFFCGIKAAELGRQKGRSDPRFIKFFDGMIIFEAESPESMQKILKHESHRRFKSTNKINFMAIFNRLA